jgi:opacity protein-like surface antigen
MRPRDERMKLSIAAVLLSTFTGAAYAQTPAPAAQPATRGYAEVVAQSALGNVTSQSFGGELGVTIVPNIQVFLDAGRVNNVATADISSSAQLIAGALSQTQANVLYTVKQPVTFGVAGVKYLITMASKAQPYVMVGGGVAQVKQNATFSAGGVDVTSTLPQLGVQLGSDLTGSFSKPMFVVGAGVTWPVWHQFAVDFQYRYGRILADDGGINVSRAGIGLGVRF